MEPLVELAPDPEKLVREYPTVRYVTAAAAATTGARTLNVSSDLDGSSFLYEGVEERPVPTIRLDDLVEDAAALPQALLKLDVQGFELEALDGGRRVLNACELVLLEARLTATDSAGLSKTVVREVHPRAVDVRFATRPTELRLEVNGAAFRTPRTFVSWTGYRLNLYAPPRGTMVAGGSSGHGRTGGARRTR